MAEAMDSFTWESSYELDLPTCTQTSSLLLVHIDDDVKIQNSKTNIFTRYLYSEFISLIDIILLSRNHEVTLLKIKHFKLKERYGEGEIPHEAKTGTGPILLTCSFPYVRDSLNDHPFRNEPNARLICNSYTGGSIKPEAMWTMMKYLRSRIIHLIEELKRY